MRGMRSALALVVTLSALTLACSGLPGAGPTPSLRLDGAPPAGFALDGAIAEWTEAPALVFGPAEVVHGKVDGADDLRARIWWALDEEGLVVAGRVEDDQVQIGQETPQLPNMDHVAVWVALPPAELPSIGFANQFGEQVVATEAACETLENQENPETCKSWFKAQSQHRQALARVFVRRYLLSAGPSVESWAGRCTPSAEPAPGAVARCDMVQAAFVTGDDGYTFEARIPLEALPATGQIPLREVSLSVEVNDADGDGPAALASATPKRAEGERIDLLPFSLPSPIVVESEPAMVQQLLARTPAPGFFYAPGPRLDHAWVFANLAEGYQYEPRRPSPEAVPMAWGALSEVGALGVLRVWQVPDPGASCAGCNLDSRLVVMEGDTVRAERALGDATVRAVAMRTPGLQILTSSSGPMNVLGTGQCGACTDHQIAVLGLTQAGAFTELLHDDVLEGSLSPGPDGQEFFYADVGVEVPTDGAWVAFVGQRESAADGSMTAFKRTHRWDPATGSWARGDDLLPDAEAEAAAEAEAVAPAAEPTPTEPERGAREDHPAGRSPQGGRGAEGRAPRSEPRRR